MKHIKIYQDFHLYESEKPKEQNSHLIIVDVQASFKKYFTDNYLKQLKEYAKGFENVYQLWDNHVQGPNIDKDYLYEPKPEIPDINDIYDFPNEKLRIEKRYNYDVDADFYKKILDEQTYQKMKQAEDNRTIKRGDIFRTTEGTIIVYIGNNHRYYHVPIKLYKLLKKLKGKHVTMVGGSDGECYTDIETAAKSIGVLAKREPKFIYSATNCPIK